MFNFTQKKKKSLFQCCLKYLPHNKATPQIVIFENLNFFKSMTYPNVEAILLKSRWTRLTGKILYCLLKHQTNFKSILK